MNGPASTLAVEGLTVGLAGGEPIVEEVSLAVSPGRGPRPRRGVGEREDDDRARPPRLLPPGRPDRVRRDHGGRRGDERPGRGSGAPAARPTRLVRSPGCRKLAQSRPSHPEVDPGHARGARGGARALDGRGGARERAPAGGGRVHPALPASALGRSAAAGDDRGRARLRAASRRARRADDGARRRHAGADTRRDRPAPSRAGPGDGLRLP